MSFKCRDANNLRESALAFTVPTSWSGRRVKLNFGAVNWEARVWVNGVQVGSHTGAYDAFGFDITGALRDGTNEIIVGVHSPVDAAGIPIGKQRRNPSGIFYTGAVGTHLRVPVPNARLWSPDDPYLYDLRVTLLGADGGDTVTGYFGMRSIGKAVIGGVLRPVLNGRFVYQLGTLDQGYWPDGIYTAPTDEALRFDLERQKALGFNMVRKHIKVEPARWFYHADRLGLLVWQDIPALNTVDEPAQWDRTNFESELTRIVNQLKGITSIVQWVPFNEGWGEYDAGRIADLVHSIDPTRLVDHNSGSNCCMSDPDPGNDDVIDDHIYQGPGVTRPPSPTRVAVLGEFGGLGRRVVGHEWSPGNGFAYGDLYPDEASLTARYVEAAGQLRDLINGRGLSASVYTEPYDVENEVNGFYTYDRRVLKMTESQVAAVNRSVLAAASGLYVPVGSLVSLRVTTPGYTNRYLRHQNGLARTDVVTATSPDVAKQDATFWVRQGLADPACYSFESRNFPGHYLRHANFRVRKDLHGGSDLFRQDATFCAREGQGGGGTTFESRNMPGYYLRHASDEVYIARNGGPNPWDNPASFAADVTWAITARRGGAAAPTFRSGRPGRCG